MRRRSGTLNFRRRTGSIGWSCTRRLWLRSRTAFLWQMPQRARLPRRATFGVATLVRQVSCQPRPPCVHTARRHTRSERSYPCGTHPCWWVLTCRHGSSSRLIRPKVRTLHDLHQCIAVGRTRRTCAGAFCDSTWPDGWTPSRAFSNVGCECWVVLLTMFPLWRF